MAGSHAKTRHERISPARACDRRQLVTSLVVKLAHETAIAVFGDPAQLAVAAGAWFVAYVNVAMAIGQWHD